MSTRSCDDSHMHVQLSQCRPSDGGASNECSAGAGQAEEDHRGATKEAASRSGQDQEHEAVIDREHCVLLV